MIAVVADRVRRAARGGRRGVRPGAGRLARPAAPPRPRRALRGAQCRGAVARDVPQLQRPVRLLRALQRRHPRRPQRARRAPGGPVRRRADPGQGGAVPAPVRGGARLPVDGRGGVAPAHPGAEPGRGGRDRRRRRRRRRRCSRSWAIVFVGGRQYSAIDGLPVGLRAARRRPRDAPDRRLQRAGATGPEVGVPAVGRSARGGRPRLAGGHLRRTADGSCSAWTPPCSSCSC